MTAAEAISETGRDFIRDIVAADRDSGRYRKIITRFPPEPNGYLHIGHAKSICLNFGIAQEFGGQCNLRFDDTNPTKEEQEYIDAIKADVHWLGFDWGENLYYASDYFEQLYAWAEHLIRERLAYVDDQSQDEMRANRGTLTAPGRNSPFRERPVAENLDLFRRMRAGEFPNGARVLRAKIDMASGNINMRDPALYRILHASHPRTGTAWCIYPSYDFAHGQSDAIEGITHSICTLEFEDHRPLYDWFLEHLPVPSRPHQYEFARLNLSYTLLSKRVLTELVRGGHVKGWDDPRMPTLAGLRRRGVPPEALREFVRRIGVAKANSVVDVAMFEHAVREVLNAAALRRMAVLRPLRVIIENYPEGQSEELEAVNHPDDPGAGARRVRFGRELYVERDDFMENPPKKFFRLSPGKEVRLRYAYFITCREVVKDAAGEVVALRCTYDPATRGGNAPDGRKVQGTIHWVSAADAVTAEVRLYNQLFTKPDPDVGNFAADLNPNSLEVLNEAKLEPALAADNSPAPVQFERLGYFARDQDSAPGRPVFNRTVGLRDTWGKVQGAGAVRKPDEDGDIKLIQELIFRPSNVVLEPFSKEEMAKGKTPDFKLIKGSTLCGYCELKSPRDDWFFEFPDEIVPGEMVSERRHSPTSNNLARQIMSAVEQFDAINPDHKLPNVLVLVNHAVGRSRSDLHITLAGIPMPGGTPLFTMTLDRQKRVWKAARSVDLFLWVDANGHSWQHAYADDAVHRVAACTLLGIRD